MSPRVGPFGAACGAIEALSHTLAAELGPQGIRVVCLLSSGSPDSKGVAKVAELHAKAAGAPYRPFNPAEAVRPPKTTSVYADGPFSPAGEAKRERKANAAPAGGPFSPEGEAKRARAEARHNAAINPF